MYYGSGKHPFSACGCFGAVVSVVAGAVIGILFAFGLIPLVFQAIIAALGLAVLALVFLLVCVLLAAMTPPNLLSKCLCKNIVCLLVSVFGTILAALSALSVVLLPVFIAVIGLVAVTGFFFTLMIIELIAFIFCIMRRVKYYKEDD